MRDPPKQRRPAASTPEAGSIARPGGATFAQPAHDPSEPRQVIQQRSTCFDRPCSSMLNIGHSPHAGRRERCPGGASTASAVGSLASPRRDSSASTGLTIPFASGAAGTRRARSTGSRNSDRRRRTFALLRLADDSYQRGGVAPAERPARSLSGKAIVRIPSSAGRCSLSSSPRRKRPSRRRPTIAIDGERRATRPRRGDRNATLAIAPDSPVRSLFAIGRTNTARFRFDPDRSVRLAAAIA